MDIDSFEEEIGGISRYQVFVIVISSWLSFASAFQSLSSTFLSATPEHRCSVPPLDDPTFYNLTENEIRNLTIPYDATEGEYDSCSRYNYNLSNCNGGDDYDCITPKEDAGTMKCDKGYIYNRDVYTETTISQWDLVCDRQYLDTVANTLFFFGFFLGSMFIGPLTDWFGRKTAMIVVATGQLVSGISCSFVPIFEVYVFVRIFIGAFCITSFIVNYIYASEISSKKWRTEASVCVTIFSAIGHSLLPVFALAFRDWHQLQFVISLLLLPNYVIFFFIPESPRWLLSRNRFGEARKVLHKYARSKGNVLKDETWQLIVETEIKKKEKSEKVRNFKVWDLLRRPLMRLLSFNVMFCWFTVSMLFFGLSLNGGNLAGDPYLNNALNGIVEIGGYALVYFAGPFGRKPILSGCYFLAGLACISSMFFQLYSNGNTEMLTASTAFAITGKFFASTIFSVIYAVTAEIFPTDVRSTALSMGSMAARVGSMLSPFILQLQTSIPWFTQTVFGSLSFLAGIASLFYPETTSTKYLTTLDESEDFYRNNIAILQWFRKKKSSEKSCISEEELAHVKHDCEEIGTRL